MKFRYGPFLFLLTIIQTIATAQSNIWQDKLYQAYQSNSLPLLDSLFQTWKSESDISVLNKSAVKSKIEIAGYRVYKKFYNPLKIRNLIPYETKYAYTAFPFIIIQGTLKLQIVKRFYREEEIFHLGRKDTALKINVIKEINVNDFRPKLSFRRKDILLLLPQYDSCLTHFLMIGKENVLVTQDADNRYNFLQKRIGVFPDEWEGPQLASHPYVYRIEFNSAMDSAMVHFKVNFHEGETLLKKERNEWQIKRTSFLQLID